MPNCLCAQICLFLIVAVKASVAAGEPVTCTYDLEFKGGFLGDAPWSVHVQAAIGDDLSYSICEVDDEIVFALMDAQDDIVYCGIIDGGDIQLSDTTRGILNWCARHVFTGGLAYSLSELSVADREAGLMELTPLYNRMKELADEVDAIFPALSNLEVVEGYHEPEGVPFTTDDLRTAVVAQLPALEAEPRESAPVRYTYIDYAGDWFLFSPPGETSHDRWFDGEFSARFTIISEHEVAFELVNHADGTYYQGSIMNGEARLIRREPVERIDPPYLSQTYEGPFLTSAEHRLRLVDGFLRTNLGVSLIIAYDEQRGGDRGGQTWFPMVRQVREVEGEFSWQTDYAIESLSEFYERIKDLEPPPKAIDSL